MKIKSNIIKTILLLLFTSVAIGQTHIDIESGFYKQKSEGIQMLVGFDHYINDVGLSLKYRNLGNHDQYYESKLHWAVIEKGILTMDISSGTSYEYQRGKFRPIVGLNTFFRITDIVEVSTGIDHIFNNMTSFNVGLRLEFELIRNHKPRFF